MAGPSKTYWRKETQPDPVERTNINSFGELETYKEWDVYLYNHDVGQHVMDADGVCITNPGMDAEYFEQGPEKGFGGPQINGNIVDPPPPPPPTYSLTTTPTTVDEGGLVTVTLTTTNVADDAQVGYTITGIQDTDLSSGALTGDFTVNNNTASTTFTLSEDLITEGVETITFSLNNSQASLSITVNDTSTYPVPVLTVTDSVGSTYANPDVDLSVAAITSATSYEFQRSTDSNFTSPVVLQDTTTTTYEDTGPEVGTYYYRARAHYTGGASDWSTITQVDVELWTPAETTTLAWYDASDTSTITADTNNKVTQWNDKSGNDYHMAPEANANHTGGPVTGSETINGLNTLKFADSCLESPVFPDAGGWDHAGSDGLIFMAFMVHFQFDGAQRFIFTGTETTASRNGVVVRAAGTINTFCKESTSNKILTIHSGLSQSAPEDHMFVVRYDGTTGGAAFYYGNTSFASDNTGDSKIDKLVLGHQEGEGQQDFNGNISELVVFNSGVQRPFVESYLAHKWGSADKLTSGHQTSNAPRVVKINPPFEPSDDTV
jgi:hypothetical protein